MRKRIFIALMASLPALWALPATAQSFDDAVALTVNGDWLMAADMGAALGTSEGYALAAQALAIYGYHVAPKEEKQPLFQRGMDYAKKAIELGPDSSEAHLQASHAMGRYAQTIGVLEALSDGYADRIKDVLDKAIALAPESAEIHFNHAPSLLTAGNYRAGFAEYEWRLKLGGDAVSHFRAPMWEGTALDGATILLHAEQGFGDCLQFVRFAPLVAARASASRANAANALPSVFSTSAESAPSAMARSAAVRASSG